MPLNDESPRTLFATPREGHTLILRCFEQPGAAPGYELVEYKNYLTTSPEHVPLPASIPDSCSSLDSALRVAWSHWQVPPEAFRDVRLGRGVTLDFIEALRSNALAPFVPGMPQPSLLEWLGLPEAVTPTLMGVCWFYGSVQVHWEQGALWGMEIDRGQGDFTSLQLDGWFLERTTTRSQLEAALTHHGVSYTRTTSLDLPVLQVTSARHRHGFLFDFDEEDRIHALYWNAPRQ